MRRSRRCTVRGGFIFLTGALLVTGGFADEPPRSGPAFRLPDISKGRIEIPTKQLLAQPGQPSVPPAVRTASAPEAKPADGPKVEPGKVHWHANFAAARTASAKSGRPVLLFQLMGRLDDRFC